MKKTSFTPEQLIGQKVRGVGVEIPTFSDRPYVWTQQQGICESFDPATKLFTVSHHQYGGYDSTSHKRIELAPFVYQCHEVKPADPVSLQAMFSSSTPESQTAHDLKDQLLKIMEGYRDYEGNWWDLWINSTPVRGIRTMRLRIWGHNQEGKDRMGEAIELLKAYPHKFGFYNGNTMFGVGYRYIKIWYRSR